MAATLNNLGMDFGEDFVVNALILNMERQISFGVVATGVIIVGAALIFLIWKLN